MEKVIRVKIQQPSAHYRIPFSFQRRFTYPIPPLSTIKGLLCNLMGINDVESEIFKTMMMGLSLSVFGKYQSIVSEYTWLRNLKVSEHNSRFQSPENRIFDQVPQQPGRPMPVHIDVLHEVNLIVYISHFDCKFQKIILDNLIEPTNRNSTIHLGRSEDWLVFEEIKEINLRPGFARKIPFFTWIPDSNYIEPDLISDEGRLDYADFFKTISGCLFRLPLYYVITENNERIFNRFVNVKLFEGGGFGGKYHFFIDEELNNMPVIFTKIRGPKHE